MQHADQSLDTHRSRVSPRQALSAGAALMAARHLQIRPAAAANNTFAARRLQRGFNAAVEGTLAGRSADRRNLIGGAAATGRWGQ